MRIVIGTIVLLSCAWAHASPLVHFKLEGRRQGSADPFASNVEVSLGDVVEFRLRLRMAMPGTTNENLHQRFYIGPDDKLGINSLSISIVQRGNDAIAVHLASPVELGLGWAERIGAHTGTSTHRASTSFHDLLDIRPIRGPGIFVGAEDTTVLTGLFNVASVTGDWAFVFPELGSSASGGCFYGYGFFPTGPNWINPDVTTRTETSADPLTHFTPLTLTAEATPNPEPSTVVFAASAMILLLVLRRRFARAR